MISEKADFFARSLGYIDSVDKMKTSSWIRKFKQKHSVGSRRGYDEIAVGGEGNSLEMHDSNDSSEPRTSGHLSAGEFNENISPSMTRPYDMIKANSPESYGSGPYNKSAIGPGATPVSSTFSSDNPSYYSSTSPHSAFYSPDPQSTPNPFLTPPLHRLPPISDQLQGQLPPRPRSQTFPTAINPDFPHPSPPPPPNPHPMGPPLLPSHLGLGIDAQQYHHHTHFQMMHRRSQPLLQVQQPQQQELPQSGRLSIIMTDAPPEPHHQEEQDQRHEHEHHEQQEHEQQRQQQQQQQHPQYDADADPVPTRVGSPTQDEAKRGMETVMAYLDTQPPGVVAREGEYMALRRVMTRLALRTEAQEGEEGALSRGPQEQEHGQEQQYVQAETQA